MPKIELSKAEIEKAMKVMRERRKEIAVPKPTSPELPKERLRPPVIEGMENHAVIHSKAPEVPFAIAPPSFSTGNTGVRQDPIQPSPKAIPKKDKYTQAIEEMMKRGIL